MLRAYLGEFTSSSEIEDADGLDMLGLDTLSQEQLAPHAPSAAISMNLVRHLESKSKHLSNLARHRYKRVLRLHQP